VFTTETIIYMLSRGFSLFGEVIFLSIYCLGVLKPLLSQESSARTLPSSVKGDKFNVGFDGI